MQQACLDIDSCYNYYKIIGVPQKASAKVIRRAFKIRMKDVSPIDFMKNWKQSYLAKKKLSEAYCVLSDNKQRMLYDQYLKYLKEKFGPLKKDYVPLDFRMALKQLIKQQFSIQYPESDICNYPTLDNFNWKTLEKGAK